MNETSSDKMAKLASRAMRDPGSVTLNEIRSLAACVLNQARDRVVPAPAPAPGTEVHNPPTTPLAEPSSPPVADGISGTPPSLLTKIRRAVLGRS